MSLSRQDRRRAFGAYSRADSPPVQQAAIANAVLGTEVATINAVLAVLRAYGLIKT